ncbi:MAG: family peptidase [Ferruginibacter sp.]|nr:family peptidase [Ferruginibacter sp.]
MSKVLLAALMLLSIDALAQSRKPLDHSVYDNWKSVGERAISNDGNYAVYAISPQEGDGQLVIRHLKNNYQLNVPRGYNAVISEDSRYVIFKIKPIYQDTRQARIKKKKPEEMPKDSMGILELGADSVLKIQRVKSFKTPAKGKGWLAYLLDKPVSDSVKRKPVADSTRLKIDLLAKLADSIIRKSLDSVKGKLQREEMIGAAQKAVKEIYKKADDLLSDEYFRDADGDDMTAARTTEGTELVLRNLGNGNQKSFKQVADYLFDRNGTKLLIETTRNPKDSNSKALILLYQLVTGKTDTLMRHFNDASNFSFDEAGTQLAFLAERDSSAKSLQKFYKLWYYTTGRDSAVVEIDKHAVGMKLGYGVSENAEPRFSKDGKKIFFGIAPIVPARDTTLVDFELARVDVWHYNDDYLQPQQLKQLAGELKRSYLSVTKPGSREIVQLAADDAENVSIVDEGNADWVLAQSTLGNRIAQQWEGRSKNSAYIINTNTGKRKTILRNAQGFFSASPKGNYVSWYDPAQKNYFTYNVQTAAIKNITAKVKEPLYDIENDVPDLPSAAGMTGWMADDKYILVNDVYDIWQVDPNGNAEPKNLTNGFGKKNKTEFNYVKLDPEKRFLEPTETILLRALNKSSKYGGYYNKTINQNGDPVLLMNGAYSYPAVAKADKADVWLVQRSDINESELFATTDMKELQKLTNVAAQQSSYNWLTAELVKWKMFDGRMSEGILYKPQNFDPKKKYPVIFYFYERNSDGLFNYRAPAPSASTINVPYFVSNDYLVFDPNIYYKTGEPGQSAYNSVVSAAKYLAKMPWVDSTRMAIQGQSWGGYQVAYLVTRTNMFRAAGAGAPVANMTSAYGGIRWGPGINRQFQYEKQQSRIGATLWERPDLYIKNSPLFAADKITTPLLIMHNDADGSVPWYQGIELFTAMRRLGKKVWMLEYNGEDHNLVERKNRKDLSVRLGQFFDYYLKDKKPARWISEGLPATEKGKSWGLEIE